MVFLFTDGNNFLTTIWPHCLVKFMNTVSHTKPLISFYFLFFSVFNENWSAFSLDICKQPLLGKMWFNSFLSRYRGDFPVVVQWNLKPNIKIFLYFLYLWFCIMIIRLQRYYKYPFRQHPLEQDSASKTIKDKIIGPLLFAIAS